MNSDVKGALHGIRVIDLTRILAGPFCTMNLGDMGAGIIKIEQPGRGDDTRAWGPPFAGGEAAYFLGINRNKRSVTLNLKDERGREILRRLLAGADVLVENFKPGQLDGWGFTRAWMEENAPQVVHCSITGYGDQGPKGGMPGYDFLLQAESGLMSITGEKDGGPTKLGVAIVDVCTGQYAAMTILAALQARHRTGKGQRIDLSLFNTSLSMLINVASNHLIGGGRPGRFGNGHPNVVPYADYPCAEGEIALAVGNDPQFEKFAGLLGHPEWAADDRFKTNAGRVTNREDAGAPHRRSARGKVRRRLDLSVRGRGYSMFEGQCRRRVAGERPGNRQRHGRGDGSPDGGTDPRPGNPVRLLRYTGRGAVAAAGSGRRYGRCPGRIGGVERRGDRRASE